MNIDIKDTVTLSDSNEYLVISKTNYDEKTYYYLIDEKNNANIKFCYEKSENYSLIEIEDEELIKILLPFFAKNAQKIIE